MRRSATCLLILAAGALALGSGCGEAETGDANSGGTGEQGVDTTPVTPPGPSADVSTETASVLQKIAEAERTTVFSGWKTATSGPEGGRQTRMRVTRLADGRTFMAWEAQGRNDMRWVYTSRHRWLDDPSRLAAHYDVVEVANQDSKMAWRDVRTFEVRGKQAGRPSMTLVVDAENWLVLAEQIRDFEGAQRFEWHFDTIDFDPEESPDEWPEGSGRKVAETETATESAPGRIQPEKLPAGFARIKSRTWGDDGVEDVYSDGLAALVIRQRPAPPAAVEDGELSCRSCSGRSEVSGTFSGVEVRILGNIPLDELETLASTLRVGP